MESRGAARLAEYVYARRAHLQLAQGDLKARGGPSVVTVGQIERAQTAKPHGPTLTKLDKALGWTEGSSARILAGGEPTLTSSNSQPEAEIDRRPVGYDLNAEADGLTEDEIEDVIARVRAIKRAKGL